MSRWRRTRTKLDSESSARNARNSYPGGGASLLRRASRSQRRERPEGRSMANEEKVAWPGAGINFDSLRSDDPKRAEEHLAQMPAQARREWLERFEIEHERRKSQIRRSSDRSS